MPWDIAYHIGQMGGMHVAQTRNDALEFCCELLAQGAEIDSITNKRDRETLTIEQVQQYAAAKSRWS